MSSPPNETPVDIRSLAATELAQRVQQLVLSRERRARRRQNMLILIAVAISVPLHILILVILAQLRTRPPSPGPPPPPAILELSLLPEEAFEEMLDPIESDPILAAEVELEVGVESTLLETDALSQLPELESGDLLDGLAPVMGGEDTGTGLGAGQGVGASFFGLTGSGQRFAYVVDMSGSMGRGGLWVAAATELLRSLRSLPDYVEFKVVLYGSEFMVPPFQTRWIPARRDRLRRVAQWLDGIRATGGTNPRPAFEYLLDARNPPPDTIFFLTDGEIPPEDAEFIIRSCTDRGPQAIPVNCIAFGGSAQNARAMLVLREIATRTDGQLREVTPEVSRP